MVFQLGWLSCVVSGLKEPLLLRGGAVQGRDETQESPEGKYTDQSGGKPLQPARLSLLGWVYGEDFPNLPLAPELPSSALPARAGFGTIQGGHHNFMEQPLCS